MGNRITEQDIKNKLGIKDWSELSKDKTLELINIFEDINNLDKSIYREIISNVPEVMSAFKEMTTVFKETISESSKASNETKNYYINMSNKLIDLLNKENISDEDKERIFGLIKEINSYIRDLDIGEKNLYRDIIGNVAKLSGLALLIVGGILGVKINNKK